MWPFIELWGFWFWAIFLGACIIETCFVAAEKIAGALLTPIGFFLFLFLFSAFNAFGWAFEHGSLIGIGLLIYVPIGVIWSFVHWFRFIQKRADFFSEKISDFIAMRKLPSDWLPTGTDKKTQEFFEFYAHNHSERFTEERYFSIRSIENVVPKAGENKERIIFWMMFWPADMIIFFLRDLLVELWEFIYMRVQKLYQKISNFMFRKYIDIPVKKETVDEAKG